MATADNPDEFLPDRTEPEDSPLAVEGNNPITAVDLFAGAGGFSLGLKRACQALDRGLELIAINHWGKAIETHARNHPNSTQYHSKVQQLEPSQIAEDVNLVLGGPECTYFSTASGGPTKTEQMRSSPWMVNDYVEKLQPDYFLFENVPELKQWGPRNGDGTATKNGDVFDSWINSLHALGYSVDWHVLNAANFGDPQSRTRLFIAGCRDGRPEWPTQTHSENGDGDTEPWQTAAQIIDWDDLGDSIFTRDLENPRITPLAQSTMERVAEGIREHGHPALEPYADVIGSIDPERLKNLRDHVVPKEQARAVAEFTSNPFLVSYDQPVVHYQAPSPGRNTDPLISTVTYLVGQWSGNGPDLMRESPLQTVSANGRHQIATANVLNLGSDALASATTPFVLPRNQRFGDLHSNSSYEPNSQPLHTVTSKNTDGYLVTPCVRPMDTPTKVDRELLRGLNPVVEALVRDSHHGTDSTPVLAGGGAENTSAVADGQVVRTIETSKRYALVIPELYPIGVDVRYRMLKPSEIKQAQGFPESFKICGNKSEMTGQIGNAVPVGLAETVCRHLLSSSAVSLTSFTS